jgi:(p)ppGpp synthase/HD superfamily hydrolase
MNNEETQQLQGMVFAPYIQKATELIGYSRKVGGNQFRHAMATLAILIDYHYTDEILLKGAIIHDLIEDTPQVNFDDIISIDHHGREVLNLVVEVSCINETKIEYLARLKEKGSLRAKILKVADRISNLTDLHRDIFEEDYILNYLYETMQYVYPIALEVNEDMAFELKDLIDRRRRLLHNFVEK